MDFTSLLNQKYDLEQQLSELASLFDGLDNPAVAEKVAQLEVQKAERTGRLNKLSAEIENAKAEISSISEKISKCSGGVIHRLLDIISTQRVFYIKNKPKLVFDTHTGCLFPNIDYFENFPAIYKSYRAPTDFNIQIKNLAIKAIENYILFDLPDEANSLFYSKSIPAISKIIKNKIILFIVKNSIWSSEDYITNYISVDGGYIKSRIAKDNEAIAFPFSSEFASKDFFPDNKVFSPQERAQKVLNLFIQEGWIPKFDDEEITKLYEKMYITRPAIIKQLAEINEALSAMPAPKVGFADGIDFNELIKEYDLATIRSSHVQYYAETIRWFDNLLTNLDAFIQEHTDLLSEAQTLTNRLTVAHHDDEYTVLTERAEYLAYHLDFGVETLQSELIAFKNEAVAGRDILANARNLASLREIEKLERPDFYLVAEHTACMVKRQLAGVDWFREHKELAATLIDLHETWRDDFHLFEHTTRDHFMQKCKDESIAEEQADGWFAEWRKERLLLEEHLLPLMKSGIEKVIPVEVVIAAVDVLKTAILDQLGRFFSDERIALHQKFAFEPGGVIQERFEKEAELTKINSEFQKKLEDLVFKVDASEGRLFLVRWAKDWYDSLIGDMLAFIEKDTLQEQIARDTLDEFRAMKRRNLEAFLMDTKSYAEARELIDKQWNSLVFRMRSDLVKKNGKGSK
ncbi:MAG: hypothetical protein WCG61_02845 [Chlorobium sp.]